MSGPKRGRSTKRGRRGTLKSGKPTRHAAPAEHDGAEHHEAELFGAEARREHEAQRAAFAKQEARLGVRWMLGAALIVMVATVIAWFPPEASVLLRICVMVVATTVFIMLFRALAGADRARPVTPSNGMTFAGLSLILLGPVLNHRWETPATIIPTIAGLLLILLSARRRRREREQQQ